MHFSLCPEVAGTLQSCFSSKRQAKGVVTSSVPTLNQRDCVLEAPSYQRLSAEAFFHFLFEEVAEPLAEKNCQTRYLNPMTNAELYDYYTAACEDNVAGMASETTFTRVQKASLLNHKASMHCHVLGSHLHVFSLSQAHNSLWG